MVFINVLECAAGGLLESLSSSSTGNNHPNKRLALRSIQYNRKMYVTTNEVIDQKYETMNSNKRSIIFNRNITICLSFIVVSISRAKYLVYRLHMVTRKVKKNIF